MSVREAHESQTVLTMEYNSTLSGLSVGETDVTVASGVTLSVVPGSVYQQTNQL